MKNSNPMIKLSVGAIYSAMNTPSEVLKYDPKTWEETIKSEVVKTIGTTENSESTPVRASGKVIKVVSQTSDVELGIEVIAFDVDQIAIMRAEKIDPSGLFQSGGKGDRPYLAIGVVVYKDSGHKRFTWYPKCQLVENTDDASTSEETFSEQNDTLTFKAFAFNDEGDIKNYVDSESANFPEGLTEEKFFTKPILTAAELTAVVEGA